MWLSMAGNPNMPLCRFAIFREQVSVGLPERTVAEQRQLYRTEHTCVLRGFLHIVRGNGTRVTISGHALVNALQKSAPNNESEQASNR